jgi:single-stranded-DNA-specific exonuclease
LDKRWELAEQNPEMASRLSQEFQIPAPIAQILINRALTEPQAIQSFLQPSLAHLPDPSLMLDMEKAVARLVRAIREQEKITVYGDYDVDGTTATTLLLDFFREVGAAADYYIPHRTREGYSLNAEALKKIREGGTKVVVTVDNGISAANEAGIARELGLDLIITDHHEVPPTLPEAYAVLNPKRNGDPFPGKELAGVGVAFYLLMALRKALREAGLLGDREPNLRQALDLVAVGTVADLAPLTGINRILVREGLKVLSRHPRLGLRALMEVSGVAEEVTADQIAFRLGPRINAVGRLEEADFGVKLLLSKNETIARELAEKLDRTKRERQEIEDEIVQEAIQRVEAEGLSRSRRSLVLAGEAWHPGVVGIVASRLVEKYHLPAIVLARDRDGYKGSARSIRKLHLLEALRECEELLSKFGGHRYAAGLSLPAENCEAFAERFDRAVQKCLAPEDFSPSLRLDAPLELHAVDGSLLDQIGHLAPFGLGNPEPVFFFSAVKVAERRVVGEKHLRLKIGENAVKIGVIGFRLAEKIPSLGERVDVAGSLEWNEWNGNKSMQLRAIDLRPS